MTLPGWTEEHVFRIAERGHGCFLQGAYREAATIFSGLVAVSPDNMYCREALVTALLASGAAEQAVAAATDWVRRAPGNPKARIARAEALLDAGRLSEAAAEIAGLHSGSAGATLHRLKLRQESAKNFKQLLRVRRDNSFEASAELETE